MLSSLTLVALSALHGGAFPPPPRPPVPATPAPGNSPPGPISPGPSSPGGNGAPSAGGSATSGTGAGTNDLDWTRWWNLERERFLSIRDRLTTVPVSGSSAIPTGPDANVGTLPTRQRIDQQILPALLEVLESERDDSMVSSALLAVARIGSGGRPLLAVRIEQAISAQLRSKSQEVSETAALSLGILGDNSALEPLIHIVKGSEEGQRLVSDENVPTRTRSFAAFGLGLMAHRRAEPAIRQRIAVNLMEVLDGVQRSDELRTAAIIALGLCPMPNTLTVPDEATRASERAFDVVSRSAQLHWLRARVQAEPRSTRGLSRRARAHAAVALGRLGQEANQETRARAIGTLIALVSNKKAPAQVRTGGLMGLGLVATAGMRAPDRAARGCLAESIKSGQALERYFGSIALAQATSRPGPTAAPREGDNVDGDNADEHVQIWGGLATGRRALLRHLVRGRQEATAWLAIALGLQSWHVQRAGLAYDPAIGLALRDKVRTERSASFIGAYAIGCALAHASKEPSLRDKAGEQIHKAFRRTDDPVARGQIAIALGLLDYEPAREDLAKLLRTSRFQAELLWSASVALALYKDENVVWTLIDTVKHARSASGRGAAAAALGRVGDARAVQPLLELLADKEQSKAAKAFAIVGLGLMCESTPLPWRTPAAHANPYFAATTTLMGNGKGLLDLN